MWWWHEFTSPTYGKVGVTWGEDLDSAARKAIAAYKRDVRDKKRRGIMNLLC